MRRRSSNEEKRFITNSIVHIILAILGAIWVCPIIYVILTSFRKEGGTYKTYIIPKEFTLDNYKALFEAAGTLDYKKWFFNTLIVAICSCLIATFLTLCVAYVMSRLRFKMRKPFMNLAMILGLFPGFMSMIAIYYILKGFNLLETGQLKLFALVLVYSGGAGLGFYVAKGIL